MNAYIRIMTQYAEFDGRLRRRDYWTFVLISVAIVIASSVIGQQFLDESQASIPLFLALAIHIIPWISADVRRLHDQGKSGAWWFIRFVPVIGGIWFLILMLMEGESWQNQYGPDPKKSTDSFGMTNEDILDNKI